MAEAETNAPSKGKSAGEAAADAASSTKPDPESRAATESTAWRPFEALRREVDRLFEELDAGQWPSAFRRSPPGAEPFWRRELGWQKNPAVDIVEKGQAYEVSAELPGLDENDVEVSVTGGDLTIRGEKKDEKEEKGQGYFLRERRFGSFERRFRLPEDVDVDRIEASFRKGVLTVVLPKTAETQRQARKISVKSA